MVPIVRIKKVPKTWNPNGKYKVGETVIYQDKYYQNTSGINSEPSSTSANWFEFLRDSSSLELGETSTTAYRGDRGKTAYDHSQETGNPHQTTLQQVVDVDGTVEDKIVRFTSATPDSSRVTLNNEEVKVENDTDGKSTKIGTQEMVFEQGGNELKIQPETIDNNYNVTVQAKTHTLAAVEDLIDNNGKIFVSLLPNSVMTLEGNWDASTNTPTLTDGTGNTGDVYEVTVEGTVDFGNGNISFAVGDFVVYGANGKWYRSPNTFPTKVVVTVSSNLTLNATHNGKTLRFTTNGITVIVPSGLGVNFEVFLDNDTVSSNVTFDMSAIATVLAPSGNILVGSGTGYLTMTTATKVSLKGDFID